MFKLFGRRHEQPAGGANGRSAPLQAALEETPRIHRSPIAEIEYIGNTAVATMTVTDLSAGGSAEALAELIDQLTESGATSFVLDIQNVQFLDSTCLRCLVEACNRMVGRGGKIALANAAKNVQNVFRLTRLDRVFPICGDVMAALTAVERQAGLPRL